MSDEPTPQDMRILREAMPGIKKRLNQTKIEEARKRVDPNARFCPICTSKIIVISKDPMGNCIDCEKKLKEGQTAIVSMDGRHLFVKPTDGAGIEREKDLFVAITGSMPKEWAKGFTIQGQMLPTSNETMTKLFEIYEKNKPNAQN